MPVKNKAEQEKQSVVYTLYQDGQSSLPEVTGDRHQPLIIKEDGLPQGAYLKDIHGSILRLPSQTPAEVNTDVGRTGPVYINSKECIIDNSNGSHHAATSVISALDKQFGEKNPASLLVENNLATQNSFMFSPTQAINSESIIGSEAMICFTPDSTYFHKYDSDDIAMKIKFSAKKIVSLLECEEDGSPKTLLNSNDQSIIEITTTFRLKHALNETLKNHKKFYGSSKFTEGVHITVEHAEVRVNNIADLGIEQLYSLAPNTLGIYRLKTIFPNHEALSGQINALADTYAIQHGEKLIKLRETSDKTKKAEDANQSAAHQHAMGDKNIQTQFATLINSLFGRKDLSKKEVQHALQTLLKPLPVIGELFSVDTLTGITGQYDKAEDGVVSIVKKNEMLLKRVETYLNESAKEAIQNQIKQLNAFIALRKALLENHENDIAKTGALCEVLIFPSEQHDLEGNSNPTLLALHELTEKKYSLFSKEQLKKDLKNAKEALKKTNEYKEIVTQLLKKHENTGYQTAVTANIENYHQQAENLVAFYELKLAMPGLETNLLKLATEDQLSEDEKQSLEENTSIIRELTELEKKLPSIIETAKNDDLDDTASIKSFYSSKSVQSLSLIEVEEAAEKIKKDLDRATKSITKNTPYTQKAKEKLAAYQQRAETVIGQVKQNKSESEVLKKLKRTVSEVNEERSGNNRLLTYLDRTTRTVEFNNEATAKLLVSENEKEAKRYEASNHISATLNAFNVAKETSTFKKLKSLCYLSSSVNAEIINYFETLKSKFEKYTDEEKTTVAHKQAIKNIDSYIQKSKDSVNAFVVTAVERICKEVKALKNGELTVTNVSRAETLLDAADGLLQARQEGIEATQPKKEWFEDFKYSWKKALGITTYADEYKDRPYKKAKRTIDGARNYLSSKTTKKPKASLFTRFKYGTKKIWARHKMKIMFGLLGIGLGVACLFCPPTIPVIGWIGAKLAGLAGAFGSAVGIGTAHAVALTAGVGAAIGGATTATTAIIGSTLVSSESEKATATAEVFKEPKQSEAPKAEEAAPRTGAGNTANIAGRLNARPRALSKIPSENSADSFLDEAERTLERTNLDDDEASIYEDALDNLPETAAERLNKKLAKDAATTADIVEQKTGATLGFRKR